MITFVSGERFQLDSGKTANMKKTGLTVTNGNVIKTILGDPFDEFYYVFLQLTFQSERESIVLTKSTTGAWEEKPSCEWKGFRIELFNADVYHDGTVTLAVRRIPTKGRRALIRFFRRLSGRPGAAIPKPCWH